MWMITRAVYYTKIITEYNDVENPLLHKYVYVVFLITVTAADLNQWGGGGGGGGG